jgi:CDGSH-type Zn-finger protein
MNSRSTKVQITVSKNGPYLVTGAIRLSKQTIGTDAQGGSDTWIESDPYPVNVSYALCRCGQSKTKPYCDGTHTKIGFDGTETASREPYQNQAKVQDGPEMQLLDAEVLCALARFCDPNGKVWNQVNQTEAPRIRETFIRQVGNCASGRLVARERSLQRDIEPHLPISIGLVEDPTQGCSGPLWVRGGIPVAAADGFQYEVRNRVTLCRCGRSRSKPFCDGTHVSIKFKGG